MGIVIVGASLAGVSAAESLRQAGYEGGIQLVGAELHLPYDRPPLSKAFLQGEVDAAAVRLKPAERYSELGLELILGRRAVGLHPTDRQLELDSGERLQYDGLIIATGATPRCLPQLREREGVFLLRALDDAVALRVALEQKPRVAVVGGGFIGLEVAASARQVGCEVAIVEVLSSPLAEAVGPEVGAAIGRVHRAHGVELHTGVPVKTCLGAHHAEGVGLADGRSIPADIVVVGVGVAPGTDWLAESGLETDDGVLVDRYLRTSAPAVMAAGDVARVAAGDGSTVRLEHWTNAVEQGRLAARNLLAHEDGLEPLTAMPSFWSDQFDAKIRTVGSISGGSVKVVHEEGNPQEGDPLRLVAFAHDGDTLSGVVVVNTMSAIARLRPLIGVPGQLSAAFEKVPAAQGGVPS